MLQASQNLDEVYETRRQDNLHVSHINLKSRNPYFREKFLVRYGEKFVPIKLSDIGYFYADDRWTYLVTKNSKQYLVDYKLKDLEAMIHPDHFFRVNRTYFVSEDSIVSLTPYLKAQLLVRLNPLTEDKVIVSRKKTPLLKNWLNS